MDDDMNDLDDNERHMFDALPRERGESNRFAEDRVVRALRAEGFFRTRAPWARMAAQLAAAAVLLVAGAAFGSWRAERASIEGMLKQKDMLLAERVLLLQRAGSAYVRAAQSYADAARTIDSTAVEVASAVLIGAAQAVARADMDGGLTPRLASLLLSPREQPTQILRY